MTEETTNPGSNSLWLWILITSSGLLARRRKTVKTVNLGREHVLNRFLPLENTIKNNEESLSGKTEQYTSKLPQNSASRTNQGTFPTTRSREPLCDHPEKFRHCLARRLLCPPLLSFSRGEYFPHCLILVSPSCIICPGGTDNNCVFPS